MSETVDEVLAHYGVPGMKWGHRKRSSGKLSSTPKGAKPKGEAGESSSKKFLTKKGTAKLVSDDAKTYDFLQKKVSANSVHALSNDEIKKLTTRFNLEQQYSKMAREQNVKKQKRSVRFVKGVLGAVGNQQVNRVAGLAAAIAVDQALRKHGAKSKAHPIVKELGDRVTPKAKDKD